MFAKAKYIYGHAAIDLYIHIYNNVRVLVLQLYICIYTRLAQHRSVLGYVRSYNIALKLARSRYIEIDPLDVHMHAVYV